VKLSIVIPLFNEVGNVGRIQREMLPVLKQLAALHQVEVIFVDDGSTDGTCSAIANSFILDSDPRLRSYIARHRHNRGVGAAIRTGFALSSGDIIVTSDSDGSYEFGEIPKLVLYLDQGMDVVTASPYHREGRVEGIPVHRLLLSRGCSLVYRLLVDRRIRTYTSLFRAYRRSVIENVSFESDGYHAMAELLVKAILKGYRATECPAVLRKRTIGTSKAQLTRTLLDHLRFQGSVLLYHMKLKPLIRRVEETRATP